MSRKRSGISCIAAATAALVGSSIAAKATAIIWGNSATDFNTPANWVGGVAPANDLTTDVATFTGTPANQPDVSAGYQVAGLDFQSAGWTLSSAVTPSTLTLGSSGLNESAGSISISGAINVGFSETWNVSGTSAVLTGALAGASTNVLTKTGSGTLTLSNSNATSFNGSLVINGGTIAYATTASATTTTAFSNITINSGTLTLGDNPNNNATGNIVVNAGGTFNAGSTSLNNNGFKIIPVGKAIILNGGIFNQNAQKGNGTQQFGALTIGAGASRITIVNGTSTGTSTLKGASLSRANNGTFLVRSNRLGAPSTGTGYTGNLQFTAVPTAQLIGDGTSTTSGTTDLAILPYAIGDSSQTGTGSSFVTYGAGLSGLRPLNLSTEYSTFANAGTGVTGSSSGFDNVEAAAAFTTSSKSINSLLLSNAGSAYTVTNTGNTVTLGGTNQAGAILFNRMSGSTGGITIDGGTLEFNSREAIIYATTSSVTDAITSQINDGGGLTKSGAGMLALNGGVSKSNITVNEGTLTGSGTLTYNISGLTSDLITVQGTGTLDISSLNLAIVDTDLQVNSYVIANYNAGTLTGTQFANVTGLSPDITYTLDYAAGLNSREIVLNVTAVPEPTVLGLLAASPAILLKRRKRQQAC